MEKAIMEAFDAEAVIRDIMENGLFSKGADKVRSLLTQSESGDSVPSLLTVSEIDELQKNWYSAIPSYSQWHFDALCAMARSSLKQTPSAIAPIDASHLLDLLRDIYDHLSAVDDVGYAKFDWQWRAQAVDHIEEAMIGLESSVGAIDSRILPDK